MNKLGQAFDTDVKGAELVVKLRGVVTLQVCRDALSRARRELHLAKPRAVLVDLRSAALAITLDDYAEYLRDELSDPIRLPVAFLAGPGIMVLASAHEVAMHRRGLSRRFFHHQQEAVAWLRRLVPAAMQRAPSPQRAS